MVEYRVFFKGHVKSNLNTGPVSKKNILIEAPDIQTASFMVKKQWPGEFDYYIVRDSMVRRITTHGVYFESVPAPSQ